VLNKFYDIMCDHILFINLIKKDNLFDVAKIAGWIAELNKFTCFPSVSEHY